MNTAPMKQAETNVSRPSGRNFDEKRQVSIEVNATMHAEGSCIITCGNTKVLCTASIDEYVPPFLRNTGKGWVTAEYGMLPRATHDRIQREAKKGQSGRTQEIQRLIGRSLRTCVDMRKLGERQIIVDCDVLQADGGTRTASITGGYVALELAVRKLMKSGLVKNNPLINSVAAISCGIYEGTPVLDLDFPEDNAAGTDSNFVITKDGRIIEIQGTAEKEPFTEEEFLELLRLAKKGCGELQQAQEQALKKL